MMNCLISTIYILYNIQIEVNRNRPTIVGLFHTENICNAKLNLIRARFSKEGLGEA